MKEEKRNKINIWCQYNVLQCVGYIQIAYLIPNLLNKQ